ncbi:MAG: hypothetical protein L0Z53_06910 [Acidobacteriales bacterium]|nr:hypothetical protein [Terriglobales bacterium]
MRSSVLVSPDRHPAAEFVEDVQQNDNAIGRLVLWRCVRADLMQNGR